MSLTILQAFNAMSTVDVVLPEITVFPCSLPTNLFILKGCVGLFEICELWKLRGLTNSFCNTPACRHIHVITLGFWFLYTHYSVSAMLGNGCESFLESPLVLLVVGWFRMSPMNMKLLTLKRLTKNKFYSKSYSMVTLEYFCYNHDIIDADINNFLSYFIVYVKADT